MTTPIVGTISQTIAGKVHQFPRLTRRECIDLTEKAFVEGREKLLNDLRDAQADPALRESKLNHWRTLEGSHELLLRQVKSLGGSTEIIGLSMTKMNGTRPNEQDVFALPLNDLLVLAGRLVGFSIADETTKDKTKDDDNDGYDYSKDRPTGHVAD
jgi:hypothetical protein